MDKPILSYPWDELPPAGTTSEVAPGVRWLQMPLPFALDHINLYLIDDGDSWAIVDTGIRGDETRGYWEQIIANELDGKPIGKVIVTHMHPDHVGQAGWLSRHFNAEFWMSRGEYYYARAIEGSSSDEFQDAAIDFFRMGGLPQKTLDHIRKSRWGNYHKSVEPIPIGYRRLIDGDALTIGGNEWRIVTGSGHSPEHACLYCEELGLLISGDQVLPRITSNVSVNPNEPEENPLKFWLASHEKFMGLPDTVLVLPSHNKPFFGLHARLQYLIDHHEDRMLAVEEECTTAKTAYELLPVMFERELDDFQMTLALGECLSHLHLLMDRGRLSREMSADGIYRYLSIDPSLAQRAHPDTHDPKDDVPIMV